MSPNDGSGPRAAWTVGVRRLKGNDMPAEVATGLPAQPCRSRAYPGRFQKVCLDEFAS